MLHSYGTGRNSSRPTPRRTTPHTIHDPHAHGPVGLRFSSRGILSPGGLAMRDSLAFDGHLNHDARARHAIAPTDSAILTPLSRLLSPILSMPLGKRARYGLQYIRFTGHLAISDLYKSVSAHKPVTEKEKGRISHGVE